jgi:hypothetical protein
MFLNILRTMLMALRSSVRSRAALEFENVALRHQIGVLQRSAKKRLRLTPADRLFWVVLSRIWTEWRAVLAIVQPETVICLAPQGVSPLLDLEGSTGEPGRALAQLLRRASAGWRDANVNSAPPSVDLCGQHPRQRHTVRSKNSTSVI